MVFVVFISHRQRKDHLCWISACVSGLLTCYICFAGLLFIWTKSFFLLTQISLRLVIVCLIGFFVPLENFSLFWRRHHYRRRAANFDLCSALMDTGQPFIMVISEKPWHSYRITCCRAITTCLNIQFYISYTTSTFKCFLKRSSSCS